jgi:hypothetical protein
MINKCQRGIKKEQEKLTNVKNASRRRPKCDKKSETSTKMETRLTREQQVVIPRMARKQEDMMPRMTTKHHEMKSTLAKSQQRPNLLLLILRQKTYEQ